MSWAAHDLEPYVIQKELGKRVAFVPLLVGSYAPDLLSKWFVYGVTLAGFELKADNPAQFHRGWPGFGFTHSLAFGVVVGLLLYVVWRNKVVAYSFVIGQWAHVLTDVGDTVGTMLFFPFTDHLFAAGAWAYAGQTGRYVDAGAYFSEEGDARCVIDERGGKLVLETCAKGLVLKPGKAQEFNAAGSSLKLRFEPGTGEAEGFVYWSPGLRGLPFKRIKESFE